MYSIQSKLVLEIKSSTGGLAGGPEKRFWAILKPRSAIVFLPNNVENYTLWQEFDRHVIITYDVGKEK